MPALGQKAKNKKTTQPPLSEQTPRPIPASAGQADRLKAVDLDLNQVKELASLGLTSEQIGYFFGLHPWSFELYRRQRPELNEALETGRAGGMEHAARTLRGRMNAGDTTAIIFYLKSRGKWREVNSMEITGKDGAPLAFESKTDKLDLSLLKESDLLAVLALLEKATPPKAGVDPRPATAGDSA